MLCNHGWEKQQTQRSKGSGPKIILYYTIQIHSILFNTNAYIQLYKCV